MFVLSEMFPTFALYVQGANVPTAKPGQSPFIPGPSRQILEGLMKENSDLKKTVSNLTGKVILNI